MTDHGPFGRFFLPGPSEVRPEILEAQARPMIGHRGPEIEELMGEIQDGLRELFRTRRPVFISTSSATGLMEAGIRNGGGGRILSLVNGAFSERFARIGEACGLEVDRFEVPWGEAHSPADVAAHLGDGAYDAVTVVHSETSTGALNPVGEIAAVVSASSDALLLVDSVSGLGGARLTTDEWALDYVLTGSQKALALPPGLAFAAASETFMERSRGAPARGVYFDLQKFGARMEKLQTPNTPAVSLLYALREQLAAIRAESVEARWDRHRAMARRCEEWVRGLRDDGIGVSILASQGSRSPTVTCVLLPEGRTGPEVVREARERGFVIGGGYGKMKEMAFRIGHMGDHSVEGLEALLEVLEEILREGGPSGG